MKLAKTILLLCCLFPVLCFSRNIVIQQIRIKHQSQQWRVVLDASGPITYHYFTLSKPARIVLDISNAHLQRQFNNKLVRNTPIENIRSGRRKDNTLRLVFDLDRALKSRAFTLAPSAGRGYRLVLDIHNKKMLVRGFSWPFGHKKIKKQTDEFQKVQAYVPVLKKRSKDVIVVIDPGHGGKDPGATGPGGTHEKTVVLAISKDLYRMINNQPGFKAYLTRRGDYYIGLRERLRIARKDHADMFVAIHADAFLNKSARGASVFALSRRGATSEAARWLAARENQSELMGGVNLSDKTNILKSVLINLSQTATIRESLQIGRDILGPLRRITVLHHNRVEQAAFVVLKSPDIPSLLIETGFITNPYEERRLRTPSYRYKLALAIMRGIKRYFVRHPPRGTWLAEQKNNPYHKAIRYRVKRGDTLMAIAERYNVETAEIKQRNHLRGNVIKIGQELSIPANQPN